ncbi:MAG: metal-dependent hydrolase [Promethearchaeota archaeon]
MSLATTHWALEGVLIYSIMGENNRKFFFQSGPHRKVIFLLLNFVALLPDSDSIFLMHRTGSHSLLIPLILFNAGLIYGYFRYTYHGKDFDVWSRFLYLAGLFYFFHILLDIGYSGSLALFYPLDTTMYEIDTHLIVLPQPWLYIFPFRPIRYSIEIKALTFEQGRLSYLFNLPPSAPERKVYRAWWYSPEHLLIIVIWIVIVGKALILSKSDKKVIDTEKDQTKVASIPTQKPVISSG